jgi:flagellar motor switch protein FliM
MVLPVSVARHVPLRVGEATIAHGTVGTLDDRVAVQITSAFSDQRTPQ